MPLEETNPRQRRTRYINPARGCCTAPTSTTLKYRVGGSSGFFHRIRNKDGGKTSVSENRLRNVAALLHSVLGEFEGYLPENAVKREENSLKVENQEPGFLRPKKPDRGVRVI